MAAASPEENLENLVRRVRNGDHSSFEILFKRLWKPVVLFVVGTGHAPPRDAEDVASKALLGFYDALRRPNAPDGTNVRRFHGCLWRIVRNKAVDYWRERDPVFSQSLEGLAEPAITALGGLASEHCGILHDCLTKLDNEPLLLVVLHYFHDKSKRSLAVRIGKPEATVRSIMEKALAFLAECVRAGGMDLATVFD